MSTDAACGTEVFGSTSWFTVTWAEFGPGVTLALTIAPCAGSEMMHEAGAVPSISSLLPAVSAPAVVCAQAGRAAIAIAATAPSNVGSLGFIAVPPLLG